MAIKDWLKDNKKMLKWAVNYLIKKGEVNFSDDVIPYSEIINRIEQSSILNLDKKMHGAWRKYKCISKSTDKKQKTYNLSKITIKALKQLSRCYDLKPSATLETIIREKHIEYSREQNKEKYIKKQKGLLSTRTKIDKTNKSQAKKIIELQSYIEQLLPDYCLYKVICESGDLSKEDLDTKGREQITTLFKTMIKKITK